MTTPPMTGKQAATFAEQKREAVEVHGAGTIHDHDVHWRVQEETRPGRGHDLSWFTSDGEHVVHGSIDVYGHGNLSVGEVDWTHSDADEECDCDPCEERQVAEDKLDGYYTAGRDSDGNIRLANGRGTMVARHDHTPADITRWLAAATRPRWRAQYEAALDLLEREAAGVAP